MSYPSNAPGAYPYCAPGTATNLPGGCYSTTNGMSTGTDYSVDGGYSSSAASGNAYVEFVPRTYQQHHDQHGLVQAVNNPYPSHPQQEYRATLPQPASLPNPVYERPQEIMYAASVQQHQQHNNNVQHQSPGSMAPPVPLPIHSAPTQDQRTETVVPALPQASLANRQQQAQQQQYQRIARFVGPPPVALACTECRARHLKCDAGVPACNRCQTDGRDCSYVKSRRGWKGTRRKKAAAAAAAREQEEEEQEQETRSEIGVGNLSEAKEDVIPIAGKLSPFLTLLLYNLPIFYFIFLFYFLRSSVSVPIPSLDSLFSSFSLSFFSSFPPFCFPLIFEPFIVVSGFFDLVV